MTQAQPRPRRRQRDTRRGAGVTDLEHQRQRRRQQPARRGPKELPGRSARRRRSPLVPFALGLAVGWGLSGPIPQLAGGAIAALLHGPNSIGSLVNPFSQGERRILVMGTDTVAGNSDVMFTVQIKNGKTELTQVPRDTFVDTPNYGVLKANALYNYGGFDLVKQELTNLLHVPVDRYVRVDLQAVKRLGDALGGVDVNVPKRMFYTDRTQNLYIDLYPGPQRLKGEQLEGFLRFRHDELGDLGRMERQKLVLAQVFKKLGQPTTLAQLPALLKIAGDDVKTDLSGLEMGQVLTAMAGTKLTTNQLPGRIFWQNDLSYWMPDANSQYAGISSSSP